MKKTKTRSPWDGHQLHPVVLAIGRRVERRGFELQDRLAEESWHFRWTKPAFDEGEFFVEISPNKSPKGAVDFSTDLGIESWRYTETENALKTWECDQQSIIAAELVPFQFPLSLVRIALHWLMLNADPPVRRLTWSATLDTAERCADEFAEEFERYGLPFFDQVSTREKLIDLLRNIDAYPKKTAVPGPRSPEPSLCAALLLYCAGDVGAALRELDAGFQHDAARYKRTWANDRLACEAAIRVRQCKIDRYRQLFGSNRGI